MAGGARWFAGRASAGPREEASRENCVSVRKSSHPRSDADVPRYAPPRRQPRGADTAPGRMEVPGILGRGKAVSRDGARVRHLSWMPALLQPVQFLPDCFSMPWTSPSTGEVDGVAHEVYWQVVDHCYLCDMCYMSKCPYVPPHEWNVDFPHLMLRAKAVRFKQGGRKPARPDPDLDRRGREGSRASPWWRRWSTPSTSQLGRPQTARERAGRTSRRAAAASTIRTACASRLKDRPADREATPARGHARAGRAVRDLLWQPQRRRTVGEDLVKVFEHNGIPVRLVDEGAVLRHAEDGARRLRGGAALDGSQHSLSWRAPWTKAGISSRRSRPAC
jgi:hypothetical protein